MQRSATYTLFFVAAMCVVASILVATSAVVLKERQEANKLLNRQRNVLEVARLSSAAERLTREEVVQRFNENIRPVVIELATGTVDGNIDATTYDQRKATQDPSVSTAAPDNEAGIVRLPRHAVVYQVMSGGELTSLILPIEGKGLWSTLYGFIALRSDLRTVDGITFYEHLETPGLGGEIDNEQWKAGWQGRQAFDADGTPRIEVIKGAAGSPEQAPYNVDGLSGATLTGRGVTNLVQFWLGENGFGPYIQRVRNERGAS